MKMKPLSRYGLMVLLIASGASAGAAHAQGGCDTATAAAARQSTQAFQKISHDAGLVGASLQISVDGVVCGASQYGHADLETDRKVDEDTIFHWASNTKMLMAVAAMQLRDRGLIDLNDAVVDYLPEVKQINNPYGDHRQMKLYHLLEHSSGMRGATFPWRGDNDWAPHEPAEWSQVAAMMPYTQLEFAPGSKASYSNPATSMMGRVIEVVTGDNIEVYMTKNIFMPLGMSRSYFDMTPYYLLGDRSNNYYIVDGKPQAQGLDFDTGATVANGGWNAPLADVKKWTDFLLGVGDTANHDVVLSRKTLQEMFAPRNPMPARRGEVWDMGYVFFSSGEMIQGQRVVGHTGGQKAFSSFVYVVPGLDLATIYVSNSRDFGGDTGGLNAFTATRDSTFKLMSEAIKGKP